MKTTWMALWPWLVVVAILGLAKVPAFYVQPDEPDAVVIVEDRAREPEVGRGSTHHEDR